MPILILKALECEHTHSLSKDHIRLEISVDGDDKSPIKRQMANREREVFNKSFSFDNTTKITLKTAGLIKLGSPLTIELEHLLHDDLGQTGLHRGKAEFKEAAADYKLWYEVIPDGVNTADYHTNELVEKISLRSIFGRTGRGAVPEIQFNNLLKEELIYLCSELISVRDALALHKAQDGEKGDTTSLKTWIRHHCNPWGEESVIPLSDLPVGPKPALLLSQPNYAPVGSEHSRVLAGIQRRSYRSTEDNPATHESVDWLFNIFPSPPFHYMLAYTAKGRTVGDEKLLVPYSHNELEIRSIPLEWRPFRGEYVTIWGRHIFDLGHLPMTTEMHPIHTIVREHTTVANFGNESQMVPVNRTIIGMGSSGGFPGNKKDELAERWNIEFGGAEGLSNKTRRCWVTNLEKHPLRLKLFPPVARPDDAVLKARVVLAKIITISSSLSGDDFRQEFSDFLESDFDWQGQGRFGAQPAPASIRPLLTSRGNYFDLEIDLSHSQDFPVAYYAIVECGWSKRGNHHLQKYRITFEELKALKIQSGEGHEIEFENEWSLYYGVNGQWQSWRNDNVKKNESFSIDQTMEVWTVDCLPILIRDAGVERDPGVAGVAATDEALDPIEFTVKGEEDEEDHLQWLRKNIQPDILEDESDLIRFKVSGKEKEITRHEWTIKIERIENIGDIN